MPISYHVDRDARLIRAAVVGDFTSDDILTCIEHAAVAAGDAGYHILSDHREIGEPLTRPQLERMVVHLEGLRRYYANSRWAVIVSKPASHGMMRMLGVLAERVPMDVRPFEDAQRAERWALGALDDS